MSHLAPDLLRAALGYAERGWFVAPLHSPAKNGCSCGRADCASPAKHPRTAHGLKDASRDAATIRRWWEQWPDANIGILTGPESGILVLDVDGEPGLQTLIEFEGKGWTLPDSYSVATGRGSHIYFRYPEGLDVRNSAGRLGAGLDLRAQGGYVVGAGSVHSSGAVYAVTDATEAAPCPAWLLSLIRGAHGAQERQSAPVAGAVVGKGQRTPLLSSLIGKLHGQGVPQAGILAAALALNATFAPPHTEEKITRMVSDMCGRYTAGASDGSPIMKPDLVRLADVEARPVDWLWRLWMAFGMLAMMSGDPGAGKTYLALAVAAGFTVGRTPDGERCEPIAVLYLSVENAPAEVVRPRFDSLGGDPNRFFLLRGAVCSEDGEDIERAVSLSDVPLLDDALAQTGAKLVIIDPVQSYLGAAVDLHRSNETRPVMDGLARLAEKHRCAVLLLRHLSKQTGGKAIHRGLGSIDLTGAVRSEMLAGSLPDDPESRALIHIKSNLGAYGATRGYSIDREGRFAWTGESSITAADLLAAPAGPGDHKLADAAQWLTDLLKPGPREQREVRELAEQTGISYATLRRAKNAVGVRSYKASVRGAWMWALPDPAQDAQSESQDAHTKNMSTLANLSTLQDAHQPPRCSTYISLSSLDSQGAQKNCVSTFVSTLAFDDSMCGGLIQ